MTLEKEVLRRQKLMHWTKCKEGISIIIGGKARGKDNLGEAEIRVSHRNPALVSFVRSKDTLSRIVPSSRSGGRHATLPRETENLSTIAHYGGRAGI